MVLERTIFEYIASNTKYYTTLFITQKILNYITALLSVFYNTYSYPHSYRIKTINTFDDTRSKMFINERE